MRRPLLAILLVGLLWPCIASAQAAPPAVVPDDVMPTDDGSTVLDGQVLIGPTAPVARPGVPNERPYAAATISIQTADGSQEITQVTADDQGTFSVALDPGTYLVVPLSPPGRRLPFGQPEQVTLAPGMRTSISIHYDSGIR